MISKSQIRDAYIDLLEKKISDIKTELGAVRESANSETKSSMGDKYETSREMMMQEQNRLGAQLELLSDQLAAFNAIDLDKNYTEVKYGCLVETEKPIFFLCAAVGQISIDQHQIFAISGEAPIAKAMLGKKENESFSFNSKSYSVKAVK